MERIKRQEIGKKGAETKDMEESPNANTFQKSSEKENPKTTEETVTTEKTIKEKLQENRFYKITAREKQYKIQVDKWDGDSLVSHKIRRPEKQLKFHKDEIDEETILERRFSRPFSDLFTVGAYAAGAAVVLLIVL